MSTEADHASVSKRSGRNPLFDQHPDLAAKIFFFKFCPKIACQAQKPPKPHKQKEIELAG
jgi:hypothetical protein